MPTTYPQVYFPVLVQVGIAMAVAAGLIAASSLLGKRARSPQKDTPYECGIAPSGSARERFSVKFYLVGMIFILFDIEQDENHPDQVKLDAETFPGGSAGCNPAFVRRIFLGAARPLAQQRRGCNQTGGHRHCDPNLH